MYKNKLNEVRKFYDQYHTKRERLPSEWLIQHYWPAFVGSTLEVGGGTLFPKRTQYYLLDLSVVAARQAIHLKIPAILADGTMLPFKSDSFDTVACHDVIEHVIHPPTVIKEMCRLARKRVVIAGPNWVNGHPGGLDRWLPLRFISILNKKGKGWSAISHPHLKFDDAWHPDDDALCTVNVGWIADELRRNGFQILQLRSWEHAYGWLNAFPALRCLGQYMLVIGGKE